jgi:amidase
VTSDDLHYLEIDELARLVAARKVSPVELTEAMLRRIERLDPSLKSYALVTPELALAQARAAEQMIGKRQILSQLHGVPVAVKDLCWTEGIATAAGMPLHRDFRPSMDGTVVRKLREAGAVLLGKLQLTEGAFADHHPEIEPPVNPWHRDHWSGASSSGSGVATAAGLCFGSLGTDTGGSIRFPSAANGVTGLKPTWGRVSRFGCFELAASLDHIGPMCRSATDAGIVLQAIAGSDPARPDRGARRGARLPRRRRRHPARPAHRLR